MTSDTRYLRCTPDDILNAILVYSRESHPISDVEDLIKEMRKPLTHTEMADRRIAELRTALENINKYIENDIPLYDIQFVLADALSTDNSYSVYEGPSDD